MQCIGSGMMQCNRVTPLKIYKGICRALCQMEMLLHAR